MPELSDLLMVVALPAVLAGVLLLIVRRLPFGPGSGAALAVGLAVLLGMLGLRGWRGWPPVTAVDRIAPAVALGVAVGVAGVSRGGWLPIRVAARLLTCAAVLWFLLESWRQRQDLSTAAMTVGVQAAGAALLWSLLELRGAPGGERDTWRSAALMLGACGLSAALGLSGSMLLALMAAPLAAACGAAWFCARAGLAPPELPGLVPVWVVTALLLGVTGTTFSDLPAAVLPWLLAAPLPVVLGRVLPLLRGPLVSGLLLIAELGLLAWALWLTAEASPSFDQ